MTPRQRKILSWICALVLVYALVGFFILPLIVRYVAVKTISEQLDREVSIQNVRMNPFTLSMTIHRLLIKDTDGEPFMSWDEVYGNFQLASFFGHAWVFKEISATNPFVRVQMNKDGTFNFSDLITKFSTKPAGQQRAVKAVHAARGPAAHRRRHRRRWPTSRRANRSSRIVGPLDLTLVNFRTEPGQQKSLLLHRHDGRGRNNFLERRFLSGSAAVAGRVEAVSISR